MSLHSWGALQSNLKLYYTNQGVHKLSASVYLGMHTLMMQCQLMLLLFHQTTKLANLSCNYQNVNPTWSIPREM